MFNNCGINKVHRLPPFASTKNFHTSGSFNTSTPFHLPLLPSNDMGKTFNNPNFVNAQNPHVHSSPVLAPNYKPVKYDNVLNETHGKTEDQPPEVFDKNDKFVNMSGPGRKQKNHCKTDKSDKCKNLLNATKTLQMQFEEQIDARMNGVGKKHKNKSLKKLFNKTETRMSEMDELYEEQIEAKDNRNLKFNTVGRRRKRTKENPKKRTSKSGMKRENLVDLEMLQNDESDFNPTEDSDVSIAHCTINTITLIPQKVEEIKALLPEKSEKHNCQIIPPLNANDNIIHIELTPSSGSENSFATRSTFRCRVPSTCESEDSFIMFENDADNEDLESDDDMDLDSEISFCMSDIEERSDSTCTPVKKVSVNLNLTKK